MDRFAKYGLICLAGGIIAMPIAYWGGTAMSGPPTIPQVVLMFIAFGVLVIGALLILSVLIRAAFPPKQN